MPPDARERGIATGENPLPVAHDIVGRYIAPQIAQLANRDLSPD